ncbi:MAG: hypothetical protein CTY12_07910, partial [Methylotenera sp.]
MKVNEILSDQLNEGAFDYIRGIGKHAGNNFYDKMSEKGRQVMEPLRQVHAAGKDASTRGDLVKKINQQVQQLAQSFSTLQIRTPGAQNTPESYVQEGFWDYLRGAGSAAGQKAQAGAAAVGQVAKRVGNAVAQPVRDVHAAGQQASQQKDIARARLTRQQATRALFQTISSAPGELRMFAYNAAVKAIKQIKNPQVQKAVFDHFTSTYQNMKASAKAQQQAAPQQARPQGRV